MKQVLSIVVFSLLAIDLVADVRSVNAQVTMSSGSGTSAGSSSIPGGSGLGSDTRGSSVGADAGIVRGSSATGDASLSGSSAGAFTTGGAVVNPSTGVTTFNQQPSAVSPPSTTGTTFGLQGSPAPNGLDQGLNAPGFQTAPRPIGEGQSPFTNPPTPQAGSSTGIR